MKNASIFNSTSSEEVVESKTKHASIDAILSMVDITPLSSNIKADVELDSPNFKPKEIKEFEDKGFIRSNRHESKNASIKPELKQTVNKSVGYVHYIPHPENNNYNLRVRAGKDAAFCGAKSTPGSMMTANENGPNYCRPRALANALELNCALCPICYGD